jgi:hypothetical protein
MNSCTAWMDTLGTHHDDHTQQRRRTPAWSAHIHDDHTSSHWWSVLFTAGAFRLMQVGGHSRRAS